MRSILALLVATILVACRSVPNAGGEAPLQQASPSPDVEFLLTSAATDFHAHRPSPSVRFRDVRSGYVMTPDGTRQYMLCGQFLPAQDGGRAEWIPFVTIKTSGYEQYIGAQAADFCKRSTTVWDKGDWSASLQSRFDSSR